MASSGTSSGSSQVTYKPMSIVDDFMYGSNVAQSHVTVRLGFLRKVYGILSVQLAFTTLVGMIVMSWTGLQETIHNNSWIVILNLVLTLVIMLALMAKRTDFPTNYYLLGAFTFFESISVGLVASFHSTWVVIQAFFLTTLIVISLTLYTLQSKRDFSAMGAFLSTSLLLLIFGGLIQLFTANEMFHTVLAIAGAMLFSGFIVFDTHMIMKQLSPEEYIVGVINLYLDIINLFLEILRLLESSRN